VWRLAGVYAILWAEGETRATMQPNRSTGWRVMHDGAGRVQRGNWDVKTWVARVVGIVLIVLAGVFAMLYRPAGERETIDLSDRISAAELGDMAAANEAGDAFRFGFDLRASPQEDAEQYLSFLEELVDERTTEFRRVVNLMAGRDARTAGLKDVINQLRAQLREASLTRVVGYPLLEGSVI